MRLLHLVWANLMRKKVRTLFTFLSILVAFVLYAVLMAIKAAFGVGVELTGVDRMIMLHKVSIIQPLPISYMNRIAADEGVTAVTHANWFGGIYQDPKNFFPQIAVDPESYLDLYTEFVLPEEQKQAWFDNRIGAIVGRTTADRFGWELGDRIPIQATIFRTADGAPWEFEIEGIFDGNDPSVDLTPMYFHYKYLEETFPGMAGQIGWYILKVADPQQSAEVAQRLDAQFANSPAETKTSTESAFIQGFANQTGDIAAITTGIVAIVFFTLLLVAGNTMAQSVRERTNELAVLKTLGFRDGQVMGLVLSESLFLTVLAGGVGLTAVTVISHLVKLGGAILPIFHVPWDSYFFGLGLVVLMGLVAGAIPAYQALRLGIVDALGRRA